MVELEHHINVFYITFTMQINRYVSFSTFITYQISEHSCLFFFNVTYSTYIHACSKVM